MLTLFRLVGIDNLFWLPLHGKLPYTHRLRLVMPLVHFLERCNIPTDGFLFDVSKLAKGPRLVGA
jgi:hypothetical protein